MVDAPIFIMIRHNKLLWSTIIRDRNIYEPDVERLTCTRLRWLQIQMLLRKQRATVLEA